MVIDGKVVKGTYIIISEKLQKQALDHLHSNHMGIMKTGLLVHESISWIDMNVDIENTVKTYLDLQQSQLIERIIHKEISGNPWELSE